MQFQWEASMRRDEYAIFSSGKIGPLIVPNRLVRSATWDPSILKERRMTDEVVDIYRRAAEGGVGLIITGDFSVVPEGMLEQDPPARGSYDAVRIRGFDKLAEVVHSAAAGCRILAQLSAVHPGVGPSDVPSPFTAESTRPLSTAQIRAIVEGFADTIYHMREEGFDGVQLFAAHGGMLSHFLSPHYNRRTDTYGGSVQNRARIIDEIVRAARQRVGDFPILIKLNSTDYLPDGIDIHNFPLLANEIARTGVDAIEVSGGVWDCLVRTEEELGFRPVPIPSCHTRIQSADKQSYFLPYVEPLHLPVPIILVGGNRDIERLEAIVRQGKVQFISLCRPLISEPDLPRRWLEGRGSSATDCISCNSCLYDMYTSLDRGEPTVVTCLVKHDPQRVKAAQQWLSSWVKKNALHSG
jgi:2,4-dienoyl-CoA reductase-like NADH-dependent reductase (Old Yellow Enzyme family)